MNTDVHFARPLMVAAAILLLAFLGNFAAAAAPSTTAQVTMFDDDSGQAMFTRSRALVPGHDYGQCMEVGADSTGPADEVKVQAQNVAGELVRYLEATIEVGSGGRFNDCSGFQPSSTIYDGPLSGLNDAPMATGWRPAAAPRRSFRITVRLNSSSAEVQGKEAAGDFAWSLVSTQPPPTSPPPTSAPPTSEPPTSGPPTAEPPTAEPPIQHPPVTDPPSDGVITASPGGTSSGPSSEVTDPAVPDSSEGEASNSLPATAGATGTKGTATVGAGRTVMPTPESTTTGRATSTSAGAPVNAGGNPTEPRVKAPDIELGGPVQQLAATAARAGKALVAVASSPQYPMAAFGSAFAFLLIQGRIDRRDPKLATATRSQRDNEVDFPDIFFGVT